MDLFLSTSGLFELLGRLLFCLEGVTLILSKTNLGKSRTISSPSISSPSRSSSSIFSTRGKKSNFYGKFKDKTNS